ncbi:MAG: carbon-nitrogen hydrolase [Planctomycetota bacterium]
MSSDAEYILGLVQMAMSDDPQENLDRARQFVREAAGRGANVICLPELFRSPYPCQVEDADLFEWAEPIPGPSTRALGELAAGLDVSVVASLFEKRAQGLYHNTIAVLDAAGRVAGLYRKMHIPDDPGFYEKFYFTPGDLGFQAFDTGFGRVGTLICWDQWYPEAARLTALRGAGILLYPTAIGWLPSEKSAEGAVQRDAWRTVQRGHAISNGVYVAAANRVGLEATPGGAGEGIEFWGSSFLCDPMGQILVEAETDREQVLVAPVDPRRVEQTRRAWPFWRDRRIDAYGEINRRWIGGEGAP